MSDNELYRNNADYYFIQIQIEMRRFIMPELGYR